MSNLEKTIQKWINEEKVETFLKENPMMIMQILGPEIASKLSKDQNLFKTLKDALVQSTPIGFAQQMKNLFLGNKTPQTQALGRTVQRATKTFMPGMPGVGVQENTLLVRAMKPLISQGVDEFKDDPIGALTGKNFQKKISNPTDVPQKAEKELQMMLGGILGSMANKKTKTATISTESVDDEDVFSHHLSDAEEAIKKATKAYKLKNKKEIGDELAITKASVEDAEELNTGKKDKDIELESDESLEDMFQSYGASDLEELFTDS